MYDVGDSIPVNVSELRRAPSGTHIAVIARGEMNGGLVAVGCHQHSLRDLMLNGATVTEDPEGVNPRRPLIVTAKGTLRRDDDYGENVVVWDNRVRGATGLAEIVQYAHRIEVLDAAPPEAAAQPLTRRVYPGFYACDSHPGEHFFVVNEEGHVGRLRSEDCHGDVCRPGHSFATWSSCTPRVGGHFDRVVRDGSPGRDSMVPVRFTSAEQWRRAGSEPVR